MYQYTTKRKCNDLLRILVFSLSLSLTYLLVLIFMFYVVVVVVERYRENYISINNIPMKSWCRLLGV